MAAEVLILGQGLAGTLLGCELAARGHSFVIADPGLAGATSMAAAGMVNPITGRRLVKTWRADVLVPRAGESFRAAAAWLGVPLWTELRIRRLFADDRERATFAEKSSSGVLAPFAAHADADGFWIEGAGRVDLQRLLTTARERWRQEGRLREQALDPRSELARFARVIDCRGLAATDGADFGFVPWEYLKGEALEIATTGLEPGVALNRRHWILPVDAGRGWLGATNQPGVRDPAPTARGRAELETSGRILLQRPFAVTRHHAGVRVVVRDLRPVAGCHPEEPRLGILSGLGAKGALVAPWLARQWADYLTTGTPFDPAVDVRRFAR